MGYCYVKLGTTNRYEFFFKESIRCSGNSAEYYIKVCNKLIEYDKIDLAISLCKEARNSSKHPKNDELKEIEKILEQSQ